MQRLDTYLKTLLSSRTKAQEAIKSGCVQVNGRVVCKSSFLLKSSDEVDIDTQDLLLGRAGYKLRSFFEELVREGLWEEGYLVGKKALDIGSSTGGFTQVLLNCGVAEIVCVDVGKNQLHQSMRDDRRVRVFEECDVREFVPCGHFDIVVCDVSFVSLYKLMESFERLVSAECIWLFKPQFEVGRAAKRNKKGVLKDKSLAHRVFTDFCSFVQTRGFRILHTSQSVLSGKEGNEEFFVYAQR
ncbi:TlyA family RNA methyltransferase [Helicobacter sp. MIT 21-1697]|uniref:23S rRNA (cytidine-2'-O)-methyltransferase TlyA n=1 Tax=Helicobacter sp. MIT 21-1697 TaxID=2993733 RepID=UPI00224AD589|nr:TlyA family RNA methyltransferase [Helicobacter sp. MIT 21-1697]MCX2716336.1 TlyA family RNA methyltransferase [Helicobacter sp. MIT 21-1697]